MDVGGRGVTVEVGNTVGVAVGEAMGVSVGEVVGVLVDAWARMLRAVGGGAVAAGVGVACGRRPNTAKAVIPNSPIISTAIKAVTAITHSGLRSSSMGTMSSSFINPSPV